MFLCLNEYSKKLNSVEVIALPQGIHFSPNFIRVIMPFAEGFIESQSNTAQATAQAVSIEAQVLIFCQTPRTRAEIQEYLGLKHREHFRKSILSPLIEAGKLRLTLPDKPTSPKQKFYAEDQQ